MFKLTVTRVIAATVLIAPLFLTGFSCLPGKYPVIRCEEEMHLEATGRLDLLEKLLKETPENVCAKTSIARILSVTESAAKDIDRSVLLYEEAAQSGYDVAQFELALYYLGFGNKKPNYVLGRFWLEQAAIQGHIAAQTELGIFLISYHPAQQDIRSGLFWLLKADEQGGGVAHEVLEKMAAAISARYGRIDRGNK